MPYSVLAVMGFRLQKRWSITEQNCDFAAHPALPPADYKYAVHLPNGRSLYTFCMCPGGCVVAAASEKETCVTNGMSLFARDGTNANSALLVNVETNDFGDGGVLAGVELQRKIERAAFIAGGRNYNAPTALVGDFLRAKKSDSFGAVSPTLLPGVTFAEPESYLPNFITETLRAGIPMIAKKADFFRAEDAVLTGAETRSSSPVRILRNESLCSNSASASTTGETALVSLSNLDADAPRTLVLDLRGRAVLGHSARVLTGQTTAAHNTQEQPDAVAPRALESVREHERGLEIDLPAHSFVTVELTLGT